MKRILVFALAICLAFLLIACRQPTKNKTLDVQPTEEATPIVTKNETVEEEQTETEEPTDNQGIEVDKGLFDIEVTLPASLFEDSDIDETIASAKEEGVKEVIKNEDGSLTYKMSKATYNEMMKGVKEDFISGIEDMKNGDLASIKDITYNDDLSHFTLVVNKDQYESGFDSFATFGIGMMGMYYQVFTGVKNAKIIMDVKDVDTNEVFNTVVYPDDLED